MRGESEGGPIALPREQARVSLSRRGSHIMLLLVKRRVYSVAMLARHMLQVQALTAIELPDLDKLFDRLFERTFAIAVIPPGFALL